jgi:hypothetical protein
MDRRFDPGRRGFARLLLALPAAPALVRAEEKKEEPPSDVAEFLVAHEPGLSADEQAALRKGIAGFEKSLKQIRDFKLPPDTAPSLRFAARKSKAR